MPLSEKLAKISPVLGEYYLIEKEQVEEFYREAGFGDTAENIPNYLTIDDRDCLFTENFVEMNGKEYEIVMVSKGFKWDDVLIVDDEEDDE